jgi:hypothetical protein
MKLRCVLCFMFRECLITSHESVSTCDRFACNSAAKKSAYAGSKFELLCSGGFVSVEV